MKYQNHPEIDPALPEHLGILLVNLGTPDSPAVKDVRRYLAEFLSDPRVVETPRPIWKLILHGIILRTRPKHSAAAYQKVWTEAGSPLLRISLRQAQALQRQLDDRLDQPVKVQLAMRYGNPSLPAGLDALRRHNARRIIVLPLYPQYSAATTASTFDAVTSELQRWRRIPELRFINQYGDHPAYIEALAASVRRYWREQGEPERLLISFHGIPREYADGGDPYPDQCRATARRLAKALNLDDSRWQSAFQSRMGRKEWVKPYTDETVKAWGREGVKNIHVICPGFPADCLETLEEIGVENRNYFLAAGGEVYHYIPALNDGKEHIEALTNLILMTL